MAGVRIALACELGCAGVGGGVMLWVYVPRGTSLERVQVTSDAALPESAVWFDLVNPNQGEDKIVERQVGMAIPTREEMQEIEVTSRLYVENGARYMTATLMCQSDTAAPKTTPVTFIASIYGMNFRHMPELDWQLGYPLAIILMLFAAALPYFFFKWKKWL